MPFSRALSQSAGFLAFVDSLTQVNSQNFLTGLDVSYINTVILSFDSPGSQALGSHLGQSWVLGPDSVWCLCTSGTHLGPGM